MVILSIIMILMVLMNLALCLAVFVLLPRSAREKLKLPRSPRTVPDVSPPAESSFDEYGNRKILKEIYRKINVLFTSQKTYLNPDLTLIGLSKEVGANKTYVSKAIRLYSGMNYSQYINSWRVAYAMDRYMQGSDASDEEMSRVCGYKALSTYIMAFQTISGITPKEWRKLKKIVPLSK